MRLGLLLTLAAVGLGCDRNVEIASNLVLQDRAAGRSTTLHEFGCFDGGDLVSRVCVVGPDTSVHVMWWNVPVLSGTPPFGALFAFDRDAQPDPEDITTDGDSPSIDVLAGPCDINTTPSCPQMVRTPADVLVGWDYALVTINQALPTGTMIRILAHGGGLYKRRLFPPDGKPCNLDTGCSQVSYTNWGILFSIGGPPSDIADGGTP